MTNNRADLEAVILAAAKRCFLERGIAATGMKEVAVSSGVARSTVYRYFPGRDDLLVATIKIEMEDLNQLILKRMSKYAEPADLVVEGMLLAIKEIPKRHLLRIVFAAEEDSRARRVIWGSNVIVQFGEELMAHVIRPASEAGLLQEGVRPEVMVEWVYRLLLSFLTLPSNWVKTDSQLRTTLHTLLVPVLLK